MASLSREAYEKTKPKSFWGSLASLATEGVKAGGRGVQKYAPIVAEKTYTAAKTGYTKLEAAQKWSLDRQARLEKEERARKRNIPKPKKTYKKITKKRPTKRNNNPFDQGNWGF